MLYNLPNILTMSRIVVIPIIVALMFWPDAHWACWTAFALYAYAGVTDYVDGYLARSMQQSSAIGTFLDPIADKLLIGAVLLMLVDSRRVDGLHVIAALVILLREILVSGLREYLAGVRVSVPVSKLAKWKTVLQILALGFLIVGPASPALIPTIEIGLIILWLAAAFTLLTGFDYLRHGFMHMHHKG